MTAWGFLSANFVLVGTPGRHFIISYNTQKALYHVVELLRPPYWLNLAFLSRSIKFGGAIHMTLLTNIGYGYTLAAPCG